MATNVTVEFTAKPDQADILYDLLAGLLGDTRTFEGCRAVSTNRGQDNSAVIMLYETWDSRDAQQKYLAWRQERGDLDKLGALLAAPPVLRYYDECPI